MTMLLNLKNVLWGLMLSPMALQAKDNYCLLKTPNDLGKKCSSGAVGNDSLARVQKLTVHNFFWNRNSVSLVGSDGKKTVRKSEFYGYTSTAGTTYRFYDNDEYEILSSSDVFVYRQYRLTPTGKSYHREAFYFFSESAAGAIHALNVANLSKTHLSPARMNELLALYGDHTVAVEFDTPTIQTSHLQAHTK